VGPTGQGGKKSTSSSSPRTLLRITTQTTPTSLLSITQIFTKYNKLKYHIDWIFTLIMNLSLDFTVNVFIERKVKNKFSPQKIKLKKTVN